MGSVPPRGANFPPDPQPAEAVPYPVPRAQPIPTLPGIAGFMARWKTAVNRSTYG